MSQEEGILPAGHAVGDSEAQDSEAQEAEVQEAEVQEAEAREAAVWGAAVRFMSCHMVQATMCLKAAGPSLRMFRQFRYRRWNIWGSVLIAEESDVGDGGVICWAY